MIKKAAYVLLLVLLATTASCSVKDAVGRMSLELKRVEIKDMTNNGFKAVVFMQVNNPNWFGLKIAGFNYEVYINGKEVAKGELKEEIRIPADGSVVAELPVEVGVDSLDGLLNEVFMGGGSSYRLKGELVVKTWFGKHSMPFDKEKELARRKGLEGEKPAEKI